MEKISNHQKAIESSKKTIKEQEEECQRMFNNMGTLLEEERERDSTVEAKIAIAHIAAAEEVVNRAQAISVPVVVEHKISRPIVCALPQPNDKGFIIAEEKKEKEKEKARPSSNRYSWLHSDIGHTAGGTAPLSQLQQEVTLSLLRHK